MDTRPDNTTSRISAYRTLDLVLAATLSLLYLPTFTKLLHGWNSDAVSHGWLVLLAIGYFSYQLKEAPRQSGKNYLGWACLVAGALLHWAAIVVGIPLLDALGLALLLRGWLWLNHGAGRVSRSLPIFILVFFVFPWPEGWLAGMGQWLQRIVAVVCDGVLNCFTICHRSGTRLYLAGLENPLNVAAECSGLRQIQFFLAAACVLAFLWLRSPGKRTLLIVAAIPVAILANTLRVLFLAQACRWLGESAFVGFWHDAPALLSLPIGVSLLLLLAWKLKEPAVSEITNTSQIDAGRPRKVGYHLVGCLLLLLAQVALYWHLEAVDETSRGGVFTRGADTPRSQPDWQPVLRQFPSEFSSWKCVPHPEEELVAKRATFADAVLVKGVVNEQLAIAASVYLAYSKQGEDRLHHPEACIRDVSGAEELAGSRAGVKLSDANRTALRYFFLQKEGAQTVYYWHYSYRDVAGSRLTLLQRLYLAHTAQSPSITVMVSIPSVSGKELRMLEEELLPKIDAFLKEQLPKGTEVGHQRLQIRMI